MSIKEGFVPGSLGDEDAMTAGCTALAGSEACKPERRS